MLWPCPRAWLAGTYLSRFCARAFPCLLCRTGFAASMPGDALWPLRRGLCVVNVKLTTRWRSRLWLRRVEHIGSRRLISRLPARLVHRWRQTVWSSRGEGWGCIPGSRARKDRHDEGGRSQRPPFFFAGSRVPDAVQRRLAVHCRAGIHLGIADGPRISSASP